MREKLFILMGGLCAAVLSTGSLCAEVTNLKLLQVADLRCEYRDQPLGIDHPAPRLSWILNSEIRGQKQIAYRILVAGSMKALQDGNGDLWDSGKVVSARSLSVVYAGRKLRSGQRCFWKVKIWDKDGRDTGWSAATSWEMGLLKAGDWQGEWISDGKILPEKEEDCFIDDPAPLFRKPFKLSGSVKSARLYISALGYYRASLNGEHIGDQVLDSIWTIPGKRVFYSVYDVTDKLAEKSNCLGVTLGNGWYNPLPLRLWGHVNLRERLQVGRPQFIAWLKVAYADGTSQSIISDKSWKLTDGPILRNNIYLGEKFDARKIIPDWDKPGMDDIAWKIAHTAPAPKGNFQALPLPAIKITKTFRPVAVTEPAKGVYIVDMGQNFSGWARFNFNLPAGTQITMRYGELLNKDGTLNPMTSVCGQIKGRSKRPAVAGAPLIAWQSDSYIARGGTSESYTPQFTFHAFRYIEMTGVPFRPALNSIEGLRMNSDVELVGSFSCSNQLFNRIQKMCQWTFLSNLFGVQSDCPHRERFGYGGDLVSTSDAFIMNYNMAGFYAKSTRDWHDSALPNGMLTDTAPSVGMLYCGVGWAMAHPHLQTQLYRYYGDKRIVEEQYEVSKRWLELVRAKNKENIVSKGLHDHEALQKEKAPPMVTPLYCESARMQARLARILGKNKEAAEYSKLAEDIKKAYGNKFVDTETGVAASGIQGAQVFALYLDMLSEQERPKALAHLIQDISDKNSGHLTTGIFGTRYMLDLLSREGRIDVVNTMVNKRDFPGWGYMLDNGATTLWEHWKFSDNTFSHNHPMFGSVSQWFYNWLGGIEPDVDAVGFDRFHFHPQFVKDLDWVKCTHRSVRGLIICNWKREGSSVTMELRVPVNSSAVLHLPAVTAITEGGQPLEKAGGVVKIDTSKDNLKLRLESGSYNFKLKL